MKAKRENELFARFFKKLNEHDQYSDDRLFLAKDGKTYCFNSIFAMNEVEFLVSVHPMHGEMIRKRTNKVIDARDLLNYSYCSSTREYEIKM